MTNRILLVSAVIGLSSILVGGTAWAVDGVLEINQACAVNTGCFPGDTAGFPVTITSPGSYRLTSALEPGFTVDVIEINAAHVTLDLNGFTITNIGQEGVTINQSDAAVLNGSITGANDAISVASGNGARLMNLHLTDNSVGINLSTGASHRVQGCTIHDNNNVGIFLSSDARALIAENSVEDNSIGLGTTNGHARIRGNVFAGNGLADVNLGIGTGTLLELGPNVCGTNLTCP